MGTFTGETINTLGYTKADGSKNGTNITGKALKVETSPYAVIDFDIFDPEMKSCLKEEILEYPPLPTVREFGYKLFLYPSTLKRI